MPIRKPFLYRGLIDLSWHPINLYNLYKYSSKGPEREFNKTAFQLRWKAKQMIVPYHAGQLTQKQIKQQFPTTLPPVSKPENTKLPMPPVTMLTFGLMERRLDVLLFRACFVTSIWEARHLIRTGSVSVNGEMIKRPSFYLADGDIAQVEADRLSLLNPEQKKPYLEHEEEEPEKETEQKEEEVESKRPKFSKRMIAKKDYGLHPVPYMSPWLFVPDYIEVNYNNLSVCLLRSPKILPGKCEIPSPFDALTHQRTFDFYAQFKKIKTAQ